jgi:CheY-like chemotaxis protein
MFAFPAHGAKVRLLRAAVKRGVQMTKLHIVFIEDVPAEAASVESALRKDGVDFSLLRVDSREDFLRELETRPPDVILSDHGLPSFDGLAALDLAHKRLPKVPFIFVTNALNREMEIEKIAPGVWDYVRKSQLHRLAPAIRRALQDSGRIPVGPLPPAERERIVAKLLALLAMYDERGIFLPICACCKKVRDKENHWHPPEVFFRNHLGVEFTHGMCPDCNKTFYGD